MLLQLRDVAVAYGHRMALGPLSLDLRFGKAHALMGPNGSGKTTLLKAIAGLLPFSGSIHPKVSCALLASPHHRPWPFSASEVVLMGRYSQGLRQSPSPKDLRIVEHAVRVCQVDDLAKRPFHTLSSGEQQRVLLARTVATEASIWLLDEPTNGLDSHHQTLLWEVLRKEMKPERLFLFTTHDFEEAKLYSQQILLLSNGCLVTREFSRLQR